MSTALVVVQRLLDSEDIDIDIGDFVKGALGFDSFMAVDTSEKVKVPGGKHYVWEHSYGNEAVLILKASHFTNDVPGHPASHAFIEMEYHDIRHGLPAIRPTFRVFDLTHAHMVNLIKGLKRMIDEVSETVDEALIQKLVGTKRMSLDDAEITWERVRGIFKATIEKLSSIVCNKCW